MNKQQNIIVQLYQNEYVFQYCDDLLEDLLACGTDLNFLTYNRVMLSTGKKKKLSSYLVVLNLMYFQSINFLRQQHGFQVSCHPDAYKGLGYGLMMSSIYVTEVVNSIKVLKS